MSGTRAASGAAGGSESICSRSPQLQPHASIAQAAQLLTVTIARITLGSTTVDTVTHPPSTRGGPDQTEAQSV